MTTTWISLAEPAQHIKQRYREYVLIMAGRVRGLHGMPPAASLDINAVPVLEAILHEIFQAPNQPKVFEMTPSVRLLIHAGMDRDTARVLSQEVFTSVTDTLAVCVPDIEFGNEEGYHYGVCGEVDMMITPIPK